MKEAFTTLSVNGCMILCFGLWAIWKDRNGCVHGDGSGVVSSIIADCRNWINASEKESYPPRSQDNVTTDWKPSQGHFVIHTDASVSYNGVGLGAVIRNHRGDLKVVLGEKITSRCIYLVNHPINHGTQLALLILVAGILCIYINYDCDRQRQEFCRTNGKCLVWGKSFVKETGETKTSLLLTSGWWGLSRHFHSVLEISASLFGLFQLFSII